MGVEDKDRRLRPGPGQYGADGNVNGMSASVRGAVAIPKSKRETQFESASKSQAFVPGPGTIQPLTVPMLPQLLLAQSSRPNTTQTRVPVSTITKSLAPPQEE